MRKWTAYVRARLDLSALTPERAEEIVEDLGRQLDDAYREATTGGMDDADAQRSAEEHIGDWAALARDLSASPRHRIAALEAWQSQADDRVAEAGGRADLWSQFRQDIVYGLRTMRRTPGVTVVAIVSLALGIGANTAVFSVMNALLLRTAPVRHPEQLVVLSDPAWSGMASGVEDGARFSFSYHEFEGMRDHNAVFAGLAAFNSDELSANVRTSDQSDGRAAVLLASGGYFSTLGVDARRGRVFGPEVDQGRGAHPVAVVSDAFWRTRMRADPAAIGRTIHVTGTALAVIGILAPGFDGFIVGKKTDVWVPMTMQQAVAPGSDWLTQPPGVATRVEFLQVVGRLKPRITLPQANAAINVTFKRDLEAEAALIANPERRKTLLDTHIEARSARTGVSSLRANYEQPLEVLMGLVVLLLVLACANVANLLLARAAGRRREVAVRMALGASRSRLLRQFLTESLLIAGFGAVFGLALAVLGDRLLLRMVSGDGSAVPLDASLDGTVLAFTLMMTFACGLLFGVTPALRATRLSSGTQLAGSSRDASGTGAGGDRLRLGKILAGSQVAISIVLLVAAGLFVRSLQKLTAVPIGYDADRLVMFRMDLSPVGYPSETAWRRLAELQQRLATVPGVERVSLSENGLFYGGDSQSDVSFAGMTLSPQQGAQVRWDRVGPDYFKTVGVAVLVGRDITADDSSGVPSAWLNETTTRYFFRDASPIGRRMTVHDSSGDREYDVRGVVADARERSLRGGADRRIYLPLLDNVTKPKSAIFEVRFAGDRAAVTSSLRGVAHEMEPSVPEPTFRTVDSLLDLQLVRDRMTAKLASAFGAFALLLASLGLYGLLSYGVSRRLHEIGIRMALGADQRRIVRMVLSDALVVTLIGSAVGVGLSLGAARYVTSMLFGVTGRDPATLALAIGALVLVAIAAATMPARRASRTDPMTVLRAD